DLCLRAEKSGYELWAVGQAVGSHSIAASSNASGKEIWNNYIPEHFFRSRFYYLVKHHGWLAATPSERIEMALTMLRASFRSARGRDTQDLRVRLPAPMLKRPKKDPSG